MTFQMACSLVVIVCNIVTLVSFLLIRRANKVIDENLAAARARILAAERLPSRLPEEPTS